MHRDFQNIINGAYHALHYESSSPSPWTYHWENSHVAGTAQYWLPDQASPTGDIPRNPYPEYREACTRGRQSGAHVPGLWSGRVHGLRDGWHEGYQQGAWEGPGFQRGFGHGGVDGGGGGMGIGMDMIIIMMGLMMMCMMSITDMEHVVGMAGLVVVATEVMEGTTSLS